MFELPQLPPPSQGVKYSLPGLGNETRRETCDFYSRVITFLAPRWRVVTCRNGIQWILQKRTAEPLHKGIWRGRSYHIAQNSLIEACAKLELLFDDRTRAVSDALPELISDWKD
jgi:hypothetical protein